MAEDNYIQDYFNKVENLTAVCRSNNSWVRGVYPELEIGKSHQVSHIGVLKSSTRIMLVGFGDKEYNSTCFDLYENGESIDTSYADDPRFWAPYLRENFRKNDPLDYAEQMKGTTIPSHLHSIERKYDVQILLAVESGSRAWGFESANSDWDVRFIYVHKPEWYFKIEEQRDVIEHLYEDDVDLVGWELRKALRLLRRCNPTLLEWFNSPIVYCADESFTKRIREVEKDYFNPVKSMYHYYHICIKHDERYLQKEGYNMKRFLYYLRGILACQWIENRKSLPPVRFEELLDATIEDTGVRAKVDELLRIKKSGEERDMLTVDGSLIDFAQQKADYYGGIVDSFRPETKGIPADALDTILYDMVMMS